MRKIKALIMTGIISLCAMTGSFASSSATEGFYNAGDFDMYMKIYDIPNEKDTIVFEQGLGSTMDQYDTLVQAFVSEGYDVVMFDREGEGKSAESLKPSTAKKHSRQLHRALKNAGIEDEYILAGHSIAGINMPVYANMHPNEVKAILFIDPTHYNIKQLFELMPEEHQGMYEGMGQPFWTLEEFEKSCKQQKRAFRKLDSDIPVTFLAATDHSMPFLDDATNEAINTWWVENLIKQSDRLSNSEISIHSAGHYIHWDDLEGVMDEFNQLVNRID